MNKNQILAQYEEATGGPFERDALLSADYAVSPDGEIHARDGCSQDEWADVLDLDVVLFEAGSRAGAMMVFMLINAGLPPNL